MQFSFTVLEHTDEFKSHNITIYENDAIIKTLNIGEQNLPELGIVSIFGNSVKYNANVLFNYSVHDNSYLTTYLFGTYSNTLHFEKIKNIYVTNLNNTQINIDNIYFSNETWNNTINSLKKAIYYVKDNGTIFLNNINIIQDTTETIQINKNITITGKNVSFILEKTQTLLEIQPNTQVTFVNLTFIGNNHYIISNKGNLKLINCSFKDNSLGLISNNGELELENCKIEDINQFYQTRPTDNDGLIINTKTLKITNTAFNNNNHYLPYNYPTETTNLKGIIYSTGKLYANNVNFTNINYRIIYNDGEISLNNTLFENIISTSSRAIYIISTNQQLSEKYKYNNYKIQSISKTMNGGVIYNNNQSIVIDSRFENVVGSNGGVIYNNKDLTILNSTFQKITGNDGGTLYNNNSLTIINSTIHTTKGNAGGAIYNNNRLIIISSLINNTRCNNLLGGGAIYNKGECSIDSSIITKSGIGIHCKGGIYNDGTLTINNTIISECYGIDYFAAGVGVHNNGIMTISNSEIINNHAKSAVYDVKEVKQPNGQIFIYFINIDSGVISNSETGKATITKTIIKNNTITRGSNNNWAMYYGTIKNRGEMEITSCILDGNKPEDWDAFWGGEGSINIYNTGKLTYMYNYLLNTQYYTGSPHDPCSLLYNTMDGVCNINYNFYCLNPSSVIIHANPNYYFVPYFDEYVPIKLNETRNITLSLGLTNGVDYMVFNDWDKLLTPGLNATITTIDENGEYKNITTLLKDKYTFSFNYTHVKGEYVIYSNILNFKSSALVDVGKEFAEMDVCYNNITYNDGNITFHVKINGNLTMQPTGNITLRYNNKKVILGLKDSECSFTIPDVLKPNNYTMWMDYGGDGEYFKILKRCFVFSVYKIPTNISVVAPEVKYGEEGQIIITISPGSAKLNGKLYVNGHFAKDASTQSMRILKIRRNVGVYNISVVFDSDEYYEGGVAYTTFIVSKWKTNLTLNVEDIGAGEDAIINLTIDPGDVRGEAKLSINGENITVFINNTVTPITITNLSNGTYHVSVFYPGDEKYDQSSASATFTVSMRTTALSVFVSNDDLTGNVFVKTDYVDCTGEVGLYINNDDVLIMNLTNGSCNFSVKFKRGVNYIYVHYGGDSHYSYASWNVTTFIEGKAIINCSCLDINEHEVGYYIVGLFDSEGNPYEHANLTVLFQNRTIYLTTDVNGIAKLPVVTSVGKYDVTVIYKNITKFDVITVKPAVMNVNIEDVIFGVSETIIVTLPVDATGNITFKIDGVVINKALVNGRVNVSISDLSLGEHDLVICYGGDCKYTNQTVSTKFSIKSHLSQIVVSASEFISYGEDIVVRATVTSGASGTVVFTLNNQVKILNLTGNQVSAVFRNIPAGEYLLSAKYNGNEIYQGSTNAVKVNVKKAKPSLTVNTSSLVLNKNIRIDAFLNVDAKGNVTFHIQGQYSPRNKTVSGGVSSWLISPLGKGSYNLIVTYCGDDNYESETISKILILNQIESVLKVSIASINEDDDLMVHVNLVDGYNRKITGDVVLEINGIIYKVVVVNGVGFRNLGEFKNGFYNFTATYQGSDSNAMAMAAGNFNVKLDNYRIFGNKDVIQYYGGYKNYKLRILNNNVPVKNAIVTIKINKRSVKVKSDGNGYVNLRLELKVGKYMITAIYKSVRVKNKIIVKPTLITKNKVVRKGKTLFYSAKLLDKKGVKLKYKRVVFKFKGRKYVVRTNNFGVAKIKLGSLKVGKYKIKTFYGGVKNTNVIKVKR